MLFFFVNTEDVPAKEYVPDQVPVGDVPIRYLSPSTAPVLHAYGGLLDCTAMTGGVFVLEMTDPISLKSEAVGEASVAVLL